LRRSSINGGQPAATTQFGPYWAAGASFSQRAFFRHWQGELLAELGKGVAQWGAGDLYQPFKRMIHLQDHEEGDSNRYGASLEPA
jgi:hypothetical protein